MKHVYSFRLDEFTVGRLREMARRQSEMDHRKVTLTEVVIMALGNEYTIRDLMYLRPQSSTNEDPTPQTR
jgi:hypothetical protein